MQPSQSRRSSELHSTGSSDDATAFELRVFAAIQTAFVPAFAWLLAGRPVPVPIWVFGLAGVTTAVGGVGLIRPAFVRGYRAAWLWALSPIQWVVSRTLLAVVYYLVLTPVGVLLRSFGKIPSRSRGWIPHAATPLRKHLWRMW